MRRLLTAAALAALAGLCLVTPALAQSPAWTPLAGLQLTGKGPAEVWGLAANPADTQQLLAATSRGVYSSQDGGQSWSLTAIRSWTWQVAYAQGQAFAATETQGIYRNSGSGWVQDNLGLGSLDVRAIAASPTAVVVGTNSGVYVSGTGLGWQPAGLQGVSISSVAILSASPLSVMAGSDSQISSTNLYMNGAAATSKAWQAVTGADPQGAPVFSIGVGPLARGASAPPVLVGTLKGLFSTTDGGSSWQQVNLADGALWTVNTIAFDPLNPSVVYVGGDNGGSSGGGMQRSLNAGSSCAPYQNGLPATDVTGLLAEPTNPVTVLAAVWRPVAQSGTAAKLVDTSAPGPVPLQPSSATSPIPISPPPTPAATPTPAPHPHGQGSSLQIPAWAPPAAAAVVVVLVVATVMALRRRRERLDAEAPP